MSDPPDRAWWRAGYFDDAYFRLHDSFFPEEVSRTEVAAIIDLLGLHHGARILDAPCGWGRHATLFAEAGYDAVGADLSLDLLRHASASPARYLAADIRALPFADATFDAVANVFTSLGLFLDDAEDVRSLIEARRLIRPGGAFLLETMHRDEIVGVYAERDAWVLPDGTEVRVRRRFDPVTGISHERLRWRRGEERGEKRHALRLRTATEIDRLLRLAGFGEIEYLGDWNGERLRLDSPRLIAVARG
jgi:SAM-dependent methyltransferase